MSILSWGCTASRGHHHCVAYACHLHTFSLHQPCTPHAAVAPFSPLTTAPCPLPAQLEGIILLFLILCPCPLHLAPAARGHHPPFPHPLLLPVHPLFPQLEGIIPALETSHAIAYLEKLAPTLKDGTRVVINCSGRGDKDVNSVIKYLGITNL